MDVISVNYFKRHVLLVYVPLNVTTIGTVFNFKFLPIVFGLE